uniref:Phosphoribosylformylglycinamidine cyclo-ligase n=1 Tax=Culicoides sonorensis TaxID=179676 RepID=A0A336LQX3_CULSO
MIPAQDHKRIGNDDTGSNTGGMGAYCPCPLISQHVLNVVERDILLKAVNGFHKEGIKYNGVLYAGIMLTSDGPKTLEFNCRFGDPETQVILPLMESDLFDLMEATCLNKLNSVELNFKESAYAVGVVMASKGYPESSTKGCVIEGLSQYMNTNSNSLVFHSGISINPNGKFITNGGRVLINVAIASSLKQAAAIATDGCKKLLFDGAQYRTDVAMKGIQSDPVIVQGVDGVGTKIKLAEKLNRWDTIGIDLVAMCANDVICAGGETAEMPYIYDKGKYDIAGYCVGIVEYEDMLPKKSEIIEGDMLIGLPSNGLHSNGYSLINKLIDEHHIDLNDIAVFSKESLSYADEFLKPTRLYVKELLKLIRKNGVKAIAHITGGGLLENIIRVIDDKYTVEIDAFKFEIPPIFAWISSIGNIPNLDLLKTFNCGIGMVLVVGQDDSAWKMLEKHGAKHIGFVKKRTVKEDQITVKNFDIALNLISKEFQNCKLKTTNIVTYLNSGVNIDAGNKAVEEIKKIAKLTKIDGLLGEIGGFGGCFRLKNVMGDMSDPVIVLSTDGCGSKIKFALDMEKHDTIGVDLVAMCVNDLICTGAQPLTFLDYYACGKLDVNTLTKVVKGICDGCTLSSSVLLGGETAEMPGVYKGNVYDLAGFALGIVNIDNVLPKIDRIQSGDIVVALPSSGLHSNGFSLVHKILEIYDLKYSNKCLFDNKVSTIGETFLTPTKIYVRALLPLIKSGVVKAIAHITGGGLPDNISRILPKHLAVKLSMVDLKKSDIFSWILSKGNIAIEEMLRTFNCGIGMVLILSPEYEKSVIESLITYKAIKIGSVVARTSLDSQVLVNNTDLISNFYKKKKRVAVLISGNGSNLQALIDACRSPKYQINAEIVLVISNKPDAFGLERAKLNEISCVTIQHKDFVTRELFDEKISNELIKHKIDIVCLAGFMRILSSTFTQKWKGKLLNIHPSLLPKYPGLNAQQKALEANEKQTGCTVHFVDEGVDTGSIILQEIVPILPNDSIENLIERIHKAEHIAYPKALKLVVNGVL